MSSTAAPNPPSGPHYGISTSPTERPLPDTSRRGILPRRPISQTVPGLDPVPENSLSNPSKTSPAGSFSTDAFPRTKGKEKEIWNMPQLNSHSNEPVRTERDRVDWIVDRIETQRGAEIWIDQERVILVVGSEYLLAIELFAVGINSR